VSHQHAQEVPRGALVGALVLILATLAIAASASVARHRSHDTSAPSVPVQSFEARFVDAPDGSILVTDATNGREVITIAPGADNFIRGVLRGMFRSRKLEAIGHEAPFTVARDADGRLTISDRETGRTVDLGSFGPTNAAAFARVLAAGVAKP
jgi:putative photosynthetic complex assembly protein